MSFLNDLAISSSVAVRVRFRSVYGFLRGSPFMEKKLMTDEYIYTYGLKELVPDASFCAVAGACFLIYTGGQIWVVRGEGKIA